MFVSGKGYVKIKSIRITWYNQSSHYLINHLFNKNLHFPSHSSLTTFQLNSVHNFFGIFVNYNSDVFTVIESKATKAINVHMNQIKYICKDRYPTHAIRNIFSLLPIFIDLHNSSFASLLNVNHCVAFPPIF